MSKHTPDNEPTLESRMLEDIRNRERPSYCGASLTGAQQPSVGLYRSSLNRAHYSDNAASVAFPSSPSPKKQESCSSSALSCKQFAPAESLFIVIIVGAHELAGGLLRSYFSTPRNQRHSAEVRKWKGESTLVHILRAVAEHDNGCHSPSIDLLLISDNLYRSTYAAENVCGLERAALHARLLFPATFLVALRRPGHKLSGYKHPFRSVEIKARAHGIQVFDHHLSGVITPEEVHRTLCAYAASSNYGGWRKVWAPTVERGELSIVLKRDQQSSNSQTSS